MQRAGEQQVKIFQTEVAVGNECSLEQKAHRVKKKKREEHQQQAEKRAGVEVQVVSFAAQLTSWIAAWAQGAQRKEFDFR